MGEGTALALPACKVLCGMLCPRGSSPVWITTFYVELGLSPYRMGILNRFEGVVLGYQMVMPKGDLFRPPNLALIDP